MVGPAVMISVNSVCFFNIEKRVQSWPQKLMVGR